MRSRILLTIILLTFASRLAYCHIRASRLDSLVISDMRTHDLLARNLLDKHYFGIEAPWSYRPPLYPFFLSLVYRLAGESFSAARIAQALLSAFSAYLLFLLAAKLAGPAAALLAAALFALDLSMIHLAGCFLSENLYIPLSLLLLIFLLRGFKESRVRDFLLAGWFGGLAALCRPTTLPFLGLLVLVPILARKRSLPVIAGPPRRVNSNLSSLSRMLSGWALMMLAAVATISPWTIRNYLVHRRFVLISTNGGVMLWMGLHPGAPGGYHFPPENNPLYHVQDEVERDRLGVRESLRFIRRHPREFVALAGKKFVQFWEFYLETGTGKQWAAYLVLGVMGLFLTFRGWRKWLPIYLFFGSFIGVHLLAHSGYRYRFPLHPIVEIWGGLFLATVWDRILSFRLEPRKTGNHGFRGLNGLK